MLYSSTPFSLFGQKPTPAPTSPFGSTFQHSHSPFGSFIPLGTSSPLAFPFSTPFGSTTDSVVGATNNSVLNATTPPTFGSTASTAIGMTGTAFGVSQPLSSTISTPAFSSTTSPAFGSRVTPAFGSPTIPAFSSTPTFGASSAPAFGAPSTPTSCSLNTAFGASSTPPFSFWSSPTFGQSTFAFGCIPSGNNTSLFGGVQATTQTSGSTGFGSLQWGSRVSTYTPTPEVNVDLRNPGKLASISSMQVYEKKSHEELRWLDYQLGDKGSSVFGQKPAFGGLGSTPTQISPSGSQQSQLAFGANSSPAFGLTNAPSFGPTTFGNTCSDVSSVPVFGSGAAQSDSSTSAFGASYTTTFGVSSAPSFSFGSTPAFGQSPFDPMTCGLGVEATSPAFGRNICGVPHGGSRVIAYIPTLDLSEDLRLASISAHPAYKSKSHEELRWDDYLLGDKGNSVFGQKPASGSGPTPLAGSLFQESQPTSPINGSGFSSCDGTGFSISGVPKPAFGIPTKSPFGSTPPSQSSPFQQSQPASQTRPFGSSTSAAPLNQPAFEGFGLSHTHPSTQTSLFGSTFQQLQPISQSNIFASSTSVTPNQSPLGLIPTPPSPFGSSFQQSQLTSQTRPFGSSTSDAPPSQSAHVGFGLAPTQTNCTNVFGSTCQSHPFSSSTTGAPNQTSPFGSTFPQEQPTPHSNVFASSTSVAPSQSPFGSTPTQPSPFGSPFQQSQPASQTSSFNFPTSGAPPSQFARGGFGRASTQTNFTNPFGGTCQPSQPAFQSNPFSSSTSGVPNQSPFGGTGSTSLSSFGIPFQPALGISLFCSPAFGIPTQLTFGIPTQLTFGAATSNPGFSLARAPAFGAPNNPAFVMPFFSFGFMPAFGQYTCSPLGHTTSPLGTPTTMTTFWSTGFGC